MLHTEFIKEYKIHYVRASEPFSLSELLDSLKPARLDEALQLHLTQVVLDLRQVGLEDISEPEVRRHLMKKAALGAEITNFPCAYVVNDLKEHSLVRISSIFAELTGVTSEINTFITEDLGEAIAWLAKVEPADLEAIVASLEAQMTSTYII